MRHNDLGQLLRALGATVRRVICGSGEPPYQDWSIWTPEAGMDYHPRALVPEPTRETGYSPTSDVGRDVKGDASQSR